MHGEAARAVFAEDFLPMLAAVFTVGPIYLASMLATGILLGRKFKRLNAELDRFGAPDPL